MDATAASLTVLVFPRFASTTTEDSASVPDHEEELRRQGEDPSTVAAEATVASHRHFQRHAKTYLNRRWRKTPDDNKIVEDDGVLFMQKRPWKEKENRNNISNVAEKAVDESLCAGGSTAKNCRTDGGPGADGKKDFYDEGIVIKSRVFRDVTDGGDGSASITSVHPTRRPKVSSSWTPRPTGTRLSFQPPRPSLDGTSPTSQPARELEAARFYRSYNPMEGVVTAAVLGGFFAFVCLLVVYKTKCKPMWKNRRKRLHNTPATHSVADNENSGCGCGVVVNVAAANANFNDYGENDVGDDIFDDVDEDEDYEFECIPLRSVFADIVDDDGDGDGSSENGGDIYFLDEFGNYVFPVASPVGSCSCAHLSSAEELRAAFKRRQSQASAISNAYTVKSLPGAYLYIPLVDGRSVSLSSIRRSLSDPEIHFSPPYGQPIVLTVNPTNENGVPGGLNPLVHGLHLSHPRHQPRRAPKLQQRSHSVQPEAVGARAQQEFSANYSDVGGGDAGDELNIGGVISIQVIQPTPNISPTCSLRSFSGDGGLTGDSFAESSLSAPPVISLPPPSPTSTSSPISPTSSLKRRRQASPTALALTKGDRRVSFSEDSGGGSESSPQVVSSPGPIQQSIPFMNYLQVPGQQQTYSFVVPQLTAEARLAQQSPAARRRRATRLMKAGSFASINSEGDGDIFGPTGELLPTPTQELSEKGSKIEGAPIAPDEDKSSSATASTAATTNPEDRPRRRSSGTNSSPSPVSNAKSTFDPLSDYTEFQADDCRSDISDLFSPGGDDYDSEIGVAEGEPVCAEDAARQLRAQGTLSSEHGSIKSLSIDPEEVTFEEEDEERDRSEPTVIPAEATSSRRERLPPPPPYNNPEYDEIMQHHILMEEDEEDDDFYASSSCSISIGSENGAEGAVGGSNVRGSSGNSQRHRITVPVTIEHPPPEVRRREEAEAAAAAAAAGTAKMQEETPRALLPMGEQEEAEDMESPEEEIVRLVLVRDIGVQVCGDSPNLNSTRRFPHHRIVTETSISSSQCEMPRITRSSAMVSTSAAGASPFSPPRISRSADGGGGLFLCRAAAGVQSSSRSLGEQSPFPSSELSHRTSVARLSAAVSVPPPGRSSSGTPRHSGGGGGRGSGGGGGGGEEEGKNEDQGTEVFPTEILF